MNLALTNYFCFQCKTQQEYVFVCNKCEGVEYCCVSCRDKDSKKHRKTCREIEKHIMNSEEHPDDVNALKLGFYNLDTTLDYRGDEFFNGWLIFGYTESTSSLARLYKSLCQKNMNRHVVFYGFTNTTDFKFISDPEDSPLVINCLTALGRYQEALDYAAHCRKDDEVCMELDGDRLLVEHFGKWINGTYIKNDITEEINMLQFVASIEDVTRVEVNWPQLSVGFCLVIIKMYVIAMMEKHLTKRERFLTFMQGTHPRLGRDSNVSMMAGMTPAIRLIAKYSDISTNTLGISSKSITTASLSNNQSYLRKLLEQIHSLNPHALFSMTGDYGLRKMDFESEDDFLAKPAVQASWFPGDWSRVILEKLQDKERGMLIGMARDIIKEQRTNMQVQIDQLDLDLDL